MKLNKFIFTAGLFAVALTGCTDLDVSPNSQYTEDPSKNSGVDPMIVVEAKMADVYFHLSGTFGRRYMEAQCLSSDEFTALAFDGGYYDDGTYAHQALHNSYATDASLDWYSDVTSGITKANTILEELGSGASAQMTAPARAMRAYFTWILMDSFGDTPILEKVPAEGEVVPRSPRKEVAEWIEKELTEIIPSLTEDVTENTYGKPTKWMATALLAKLYINWAVYTAESVDKYDAANTPNQKLDDCIAACDEIIKSGKFNLGSVDYLHKFSYDNSWKVEDFIYAMPYDALTLQGFQYARPRSFKQRSSALRATSVTSASCVVMSTIVILRPCVRQANHSSIMVSRYISPKRSISLSRTTPSTWVMTTMLSSRVATPSSGSSFLMTTTTAVTSLTTCRSSVMPISFS